MISQSLNKRRLISALIYYCILTSDNKPPKKVFVSIAKTSVYFVNAMVYCRTGKDDLKKPSWRYQVKYAFARKIVGLPFILLCKFQQISRNDKRLYNCQPILKTYFIFDKVLYLKYFSVFRQDIQNLNHSYDKEGLKFKKKS